ncbi:transglycosylase SLT domain-containing protein [Myxococcota bacterium]|nr:transglycosylase SLT domain-containing protein [Myxococcota bacterium]
MFQLLPLLLILWGAEPSPFLSGPSEAARLNPPTDGRTWVRGRAVSSAGTPATLWALQLAEEDLFRASEKTQENLPVSAQPPVPAELAWLAGMKYPDIPIVFDETVITYLKYFRFNPGGRATIRSWIEHSGRYRAMILNVLARHKLPSALLYIAMIESGYEVGTRSSAGALGLWQFMPDGAKVYGLRLSHFVDQRMDPELSTEAVMLYFSDLKFRFHNWPVALAAYNCGYGRMLQSIRRYQSNDFWKLQKYENALPRETQLYVPKWIAVAIADLNRDRFLIPKPSMKPAYTFDAVPAPGGMTFSQVARLAGVGEDEIRALNPEYTRRRLPPDQKWVRVRLPWGRKTTYETALRKLSPQWADFQVYRVQFGETLDSVAARFGISTAKLRSMNQLQSSAEVVPGVTLVVPRTAKLEEPVRAELKTPFVAVPGDVAVPDGLVRMFYRTCAGDTLEILVEGLGAREEDLISWNHLNPEAALPSGMVLQVFLAPAAATHKALFAADTVKVVPVDGEEFIAHYLVRYDRVRILHTLTANQKLDRVAEKYGTTVTSIRTINKAHSFATGTTIVVYAKKDRVPRQVTTPESVPEKPEQPEKPADKPADKPVDKPAEKPAEPEAGPPPVKEPDPGLESGNKPSNPADPPAEKPADPETEKPAEKPADKPAEKPADKPLPAGPESSEAEKPKSSLSRMLTDASRVLINLAPRLPLTTQLKRDQLSSSGRVWVGRPAEDPQPASPPAPAPVPEKDSRP